MTKDKFISSHRLSLLSRAKSINIISAADGSVKENISYS